MKMSLVNKIIWIIVGLLFIGCLAAGVAVKGWRSERGEIKILETTPKDGEKFVSRDKAVYIYLSRTLMTDEKADGNFLLKVGGINISHTEEIVNNVVKIKPIKNFEYGQKVEVVVRKELLGGNENYVFGFKVELPQDMKLDDWKYQAVERNLRLMKNYSEGLREIGVSVQGKNIYLIKLGQGSKKILLVGGHHGYEEESTSMLMRLADYFVRNAGEIPKEVSIWIVPALNPDGLDKSQRQNANGVDLNRNYGVSNWVLDKTTMFYSGPYPFSEPETRAVRTLFDEEQFSLAITYHTNRNLVESNSYKDKFIGFNKYLEKVVARTGYKYLDASDFSFEDLESKGEFVSWLYQVYDIPAVCVEMKTEPVEKSFERNKILLREMIKWVTK
ncbi:hypothetical protein COS78_02225 [Candidatus Shapirobacteria bacterium CG06_land_8_20_14_3_00_40_12]|uniref:Peptidase M14 domain-containing protein n=1 Tax=Candidatus Shapirobacteria bacterium CG06_land_8_20_14_3_00_40_12 TaxID=1974881 RepID=A0A2M7AS53_9BACT|nr:MAG: hypothetical protein COS78_02225 [Candidatus Shapirobacteria bacterium CG06_land_8_20_14_3_00_40_12]